MNAYNYIKKNYPGVTVSKQTDSGKVIRVVTAKSRLTLNTAELTEEKIDFLLSHIA